MNGQLDPSQFIITKKRKKYKFALFSNSPLCFEHNQWDKHWQVDVLEIGAGTGQFSLKLAGQYPSKNHLAVDLKADRLQKGAGLAEASKLKNLRFLRTRADLLPELIRTRSVESIWLTFPDPFPRQRSAKHRLTHPRYLKMYQELLKPGGQLLLKHDNLEFFQYSLEKIVESGWQINQLSFDLHQSDLPDEYKILTTYEQRWMNEGAMINFLSAVKPK